MYPYRSLTEGRKHDIRHYRPVDDKQKNDEKSIVIHGRLILFYYTCKNLIIGNRKMGFGHSVCDVQTEIAVRQVSIVDKKYS